MEYKIIYSDRKTISILIKNGEVIVRAPRGIPQKKISEMVGKNREWIDKNLEKSRKKKELYESLSLEDIKALKDRAKIVLKDKTEHYSKIMGLKHGRITITSAKTRFGSCSSKGNISYSYRLLLYPEAAWDYVVVHELAHLVEMNHSPKFYKIIEKILPDYKKRRDCLK